MQTSLKRALTGSLGLVPFCVFGAFEAERYLADEVMLRWDFLPETVISQTVERAPVPDGDFITLATLSPTIEKFKDDNGGAKLPPGSAWTYRLKQISWDDTLVSESVKVEIPDAIASEGWRVLPIRFKSEYDAGMSGGEGEQHFHSMDRCLTHPEVIYLNQDICGPWRSVDSGDSWQKTLDVGLYLNNGQSIAVDPINPSILLIEVDNTYNYRATGDEGIYLSRDGGDHWTRVLATATNYAGANGRSFRKAIACDLSSVTEERALRWYVALPNNGIYVSEDGGESFLPAPLSSLAGHDVVFQVCPHPTDGKSLWVGTDQGLFFSSVGGAALHALGDLPSGRVTSVAIDGRDPDRLYAVVEGTGLYRSLDGGTHFSLLKSFDVRRLFLNPGFPDTLYLVGATHTIVSHNGGASWIENTASIAHPEVGSPRTGNSMEIDGALAGIAPNPLDPNEAVAFAKASIWKTTDGGSIYYDSSALFTGYAWSWWNRAAAFDRFDPQRWAFFNNDVGMTITTTGGDWFENRNPQAWNWYQNGYIEWIGTYAGDFQPVSGSNRIVASVGGYFRTQLMQTSNAGSSWELLVDPSNLDTSVDRHLFVSFHPNDANFVYAGNKFSTNAGASFALIDFGSYASMNPTLVGMCEGFPDTVYALAEDRQALLRSDDRGVQWTLYTSPSWRLAPFDSLPTFAVHPQNPDVVFSVDAGGDLARFDGSTWTSLGVLDALEAAPHAADYNYVRTVAVDPKDGDTLYAGMFASGVECAWRSVDGGNSWENITENLPRIGLSALSVNPHTGELFVGSGIGTWIYPAPTARGNPVYRKAHSRPGTTVSSKSGYQAWRLNQFSFPDFLDDVISGRDADPDQDRNKNLVEYAFGWPPLSADRPDGGWKISSDSSEESALVQIEFNKRADDFVIDFQLHCSLDLKTWDPVPEAASNWELIEVEAGPWEHWRVEYSMAPDDPVSRFLRIEVQELDR